MLKWGVVKKLIGGYWPLLLILIVYFSFSFLTFRDYGITVDEPREYFWGKELLKHLGRETKFENTVVKTYETAPAVRRFTPLLSKYSRWYQALVVAFNAPGFFERAHFINMAFSSLLFAAIYMLVYLQYKKGLPATLATLFTILTPRLLGHLPANPKDTPFAVMYFISTALTLVAVTKVKNPMYKILILSLPFGLTQGIRLVGFTLYVIYLIFEYVKNKKIAWAETLLLFGVSNFLMIAFFPHIGVNYFKNFYHLLRDTQEFSYWTKDIFFFGEYIRVGDRPWYYLPIFLLVTTPIFILVFFVANLKWTKRFANNDIVRAAWLVLGLNLIAYLTLNPVTYNGLRHFLYLLPFISIISALTFYEFICGNKNLTKWIVCGLVGLNVLLVFTSLGRLHPYEYMYFNEFVGGTRGAAKNFELDYWDVSYKQAFEWLAVNEFDQKDTTYYVSACNSTTAILYYAKILGVNIQTSFEKNENPYYQICDYHRSINFEYDISKTNQNLIWVVEKNGVPLNYIFKY